MDTARSAALVCLICLASADTAAPQEREYDNGVALAQLGRWDDARAALLAGSRLHPLDARFPAELAGVAFKQRRYGEAIGWLRRAQRLNPDDPYVAEFLATIYFLQGNLAGALKYWNRIGKPIISSVGVEPALRVDPVLLDHAFAFAPSGVLRLSDLLTSEARLNGLGIFSTYNFRLQARDDGQFDLAFAAHERNGWGDTRQEALLSLLRGVAYQTVYPEYFNLRRSAINVTSMVRWDAQKRRLAAAVSGPRFRIGMDLRNENWERRGASFKLYRSAVRGEFLSVQSGAWSWSTGGEVSHREYPGLHGYQLKHLAQLNLSLWRMPERRFESRLTISSEAGRIWSAPTHAFEKLQASISGSWTPKMTGDDYTVRQQFRTGRIFGQAPFDELFILGLERDNDLWMRGHVGTRDGRKGSAPMGPNYFLSNSEIDKNVFTGNFLSVKLSPFLDAGKVTDSAKMLWDTGVQLKVRVLGVGFALIYGKDLRSGGNAYYLTALPIR